MLDVGTPLGLLYVEYLESAFSLSVYFGSFFLGLMHNAIILSFWWGAIIWFLKRHHCIHGALTSVVAFEFIWQWWDVICSVISLDCLAIRLRVWSVGQLFIIVRGISYLPMAIWLLSHRWIGLVLSILLHHLLLLRALCINQIFLLFLFIFILTHNILGQLSMVLWAAILACLLLRITITPFLVSILHQSLCPHINHTICFYDGCDSFSFFKWIEFLELFL